MVRRGSGTHPSAVCSGFIGSVGNGVSGPLEAESGGINPELSPCTHGMRKG